MPLFAIVALNFAVGVLAAQAAARELRASPRGVTAVRAFRAVAAHQALVAMPVAGFVLLRLGDWAVSYLVDGARIPSAVLAAVVLLHGAAGLAGFALGAHLLREHRARWIGIIAGACAVLVLLAAAVAHRRLGVVASYVQYRGAFGTRSLWRSAALEPLLALLALWTAGGAHLLWALARRL